MRKRGMQHEYIARYQRTNGDAQAGEFTLKAHSDGEARTKAIHQLRAYGVRYKFKLDVKRRTQGAWGAQGTTQQGDKH